MIFEVAHHMALLPLLWLAVLHFRGRNPGVAWFWLAGVFLVSWLADLASHWADSWLVGLVYPLTQAAIVGAVFLPRRRAIELVVALVVLGSVDALWLQATGPDIMLRTAAWLSIVGILYPLWQLGRLRTALLVSFGLGWIAWLLYAVRPGWYSWGLYQGVRLLGILLFCFAATDPHPRFRLEKKPASR